MQSKIDKIKTVVAHHYQIEVPDMISKKRNREFCLPRQVAMYITYKMYPDLSLKNIGDAFFGRDHSTVIHSVKTIEDLIYYDKGLSNTVNQLMQDCHFLDINLLPNDLKGILIGREEYPISER
jgi:chromosomal replication initiator protein